MASTVIAGKPSNTVGEKDSTLILRGSSVKILWGNKFIDLVKNGKINANADKILKIADSIESVNSDGIYLIDDLIWISINGTKMLLSENTDTTYVSFLRDLKEITPELKLRALTNIGFYYNTYKEAEEAGLSTGLVYILEDNKLYIIQNGKLNIYNPVINDVILEENPKLDEEELDKKKDLYIEGSSLWLDDEEAIIVNSDNILVQYKLITEYTGIESVQANSQNGFRLYLNENGESIFEIDNIIWRKYPIWVTFLELYAMIQNKTLSPKMYYMITDFQNPWEVTWEDEQLLYNNTYDFETGELSGLRNAMHLIVQAASYDSIYERVWSLENPKWIINYDPLYLGQKHILSENYILYGFRSRTNTEGKVLYLPCKGKITYLKDEYDNEGNFNFRLFMFKFPDYWRYCVDKTPGNEAYYFGEFLKCYRNTFNIDSIEAFVLVFKFNRIENELGELTGYLIEAIDDDVKLSTGHHLYINGLSVNDNIFNLLSTNETVQHYISCSNFQNNSFSNIEKSITVYYDMYNNLFLDIKGPITVRAKISGNKIINIKNSVTIKNNTLFNDNYISNFDTWLDNNNIFERNTIKLSTGIIINNATIRDNNIDNIKGTILNDSLIINNTIKVVRDLSNNNMFSNNIIDEIRTYVTNEGIISDNVIGSLTVLDNTENINNNIITAIDSVDNSGNIVDNTLDNIKELKNSGTFSENIIEKSLGIINNDGIINQNNIVNINTDLSNSNNIINNNINSISELTIEANIEHNTINNISKSTVKGNIINNLLADILDTTFNNEFQDNVFKDFILSSNFGIFTNNEANKSFTKFNSLLGNVDSCIFHRPITLLTITSIILNCIFNYINNLELTIPVYYTTFHGSIGNIDKELTLVEKNLLSDPTKKTDAYPNIKVVCVPEIITKGMIIMWYGKEEIPDGWAICDGENGTPNLIGKFVKASDIADVESGGGNYTDDNNNNNYIKLTNEHLPEHSHTIPELTTSEAGLHEHEYLDEYTDWTNDTLYSIVVNNIVPSGGNTLESIGLSSDTYSVKEGEFGRTTVSSGTHVHTIPSFTIEDNSETPNTPFSIEPKYYTLIFIMKL